MCVCMCACVTPSRKQKDNSDIRKYITESKGLLPILELVLMCIIVQTMDYSVPMLWCISVPTHTTHVSQVLGTKPGMAGGGPR